MKDSNYITDYNEEYNKYKFDTTATDMIILSLIVLAIFSIGFIVGVCLK